MRQGEYGELFFHEEKGEDDQGKIDTKYGYTLNNFSLSGFFEDNGDTGDAAGREAVSYTHLDVYKRQDDIHAQLRRHRGVILCL